MTATERRDHVAPWLRNPYFFQLTKKRNQKIRQKDLKFLSPGVELSRAFGWYGWKLYRYLKSRKGLNLKSEFLHFVESFSLARLSRKVFDKKGRICVNFLHISKTGGAQLRSQLALLNSVSGKYFFENYGHSARISDLPPSELFFATIRDPISRFYSAFHARRGGFLSGRPRPAAEEWALSTFENANLLAEALAPRHRKLGDAVRAMQSIKHLNQPMYDNFSSGIERRPVFIVRQENLNDDFLTLLRLLEFDLPPEDFSISTNINATDYRRAGAQALSDDAKKNLKSWYAKDYLILNHYSELMENFWK